MFKNKFLTFISFLLVTFGASAIGSFATINYKEPWYSFCLLYTSPSPRDVEESRMPSSA